MNLFVKLSNFSFVFGLSLDCFHRSRLSEEAKTKKNENVDIGTRSVFALGHISLVSSLIWRPSIYKGFSLVPAQHWILSGWKWDKKANLGQTQGWGVIWLPTIVPLNGPHGPSWVCKVRMEKFHCVLTSNTFARKAPILLDAGEVQQQHSL
jgi:hypothetical protein